MSAHTPGPWHVRVPKPSRRPAYPVVDKDGAHVAEVVIMAAGSSGANARLIAAAPDLLAALKDMEMLVNAIGDARKDAKYLDAARAAIAKAEVSE